MPRRIVPRGGNQGKLRPIGQILLTLEPGGDMPSHLDKFTCRSAGRMRSEYGSRRLANGTSLASHADAFNGSRLVERKAELDGAAATGRTRLSAKRQFRIKRIPC